MKLTTLRMTSRASSPFGLSFARCSMRRKVSSLTHALNSANASGRDCTLTATALLTACRCATLALWNTNAMSCAKRAS